MKADRVDVCPERTDIDSNDSDLIHKHLDQAYSARFTITRAGDASTGCSCTHSRIDVGSYAIEEIRHDGDVMLRADRVPSVVALFVRSGRAEVVHGRLAGTAGPGEWVLASTGVGGVQVRVVGAELRSVVLSRSLLTEVAAIDTDAASVPRFTGLTPTTGTAGRTLDATERFLHRILTAPEPTESRILLASAGRMLAGAVLSAFPNDLPADGAADTSGNAHPALLRQAVDFIGDNAAHDIGVGDVASALYLSPRTVQYMFRRHLDTTPTAYLREVRLARARRNSSPVIAASPPWPPPRRAGGLPTRVASRSCTGAPSAKAHTKRCAADRPPPCVCRTTKIGLWTLSGRSVDPGSAAATTSRPAEAAMTEMLTNAAQARALSPRLEFATEWRDIDLAVITVTGDVDAANSHRLLDYTLSKVLLCRRMILDLSQVGFFASDGYRMLKVLESRCVLADIEFHLVPGAHVGRTLQICRRADQHEL